MPNLLINGILFAPDYLEILQIALTTPPPNPTRWTFLSLHEPLSLSLCLFIILHLFLFPPTLILHLLPVIFPTRDPPSAITRNTMVATLTMLSPTIHIQGQQLTLCPSGLL